MIKMQTHGHTSRVNGGQGILRPHTTATAMPKTTMYGDFRQVKSATTERPRQATDAQQHYAQSWLPYGGPIGYRENKIIKGMAKQLEGNVPEGSPRVVTKRIEIRPRVLHHSTPQARKDFTHINSLFSKSRGYQKGHFAIHPEWASEERGMKRNLSQMMSTRGEHGIRYGSK